MADRSRWEPPARAKSRYKQFRLTYTEEVNGRVSVSIYAKPLNAAWNEQQCMMRFTEEVGQHVESLEGVAARLIVLLEDAFPSLSRE